MSYRGPKTLNLDPVINYISNGRAYDSTIGWATYADAAGAQPVDGTGGSPNVTWSRDTTTPLRQGADFNFVKDAANRQGQGVSYDFTIDNADLAKVLTVTFDYEVLSGTYATGDLTVYLIQDTSGTPTVVQPAGYQIQSATVGTKMRQIATFQTASNVTSYRLCLHVASVSASAYSLAIDNVVVGPQVVQYGAPVTDWQDFPSVAAGTLITAVTTSPTYGTVSVNKAQWRRVGSDMEIRWDFRQGTAGTNGSGMYLFNLPAGFSIDTSKVTTNTGNTIGDFPAKSLGVFQYEAPTSNYYGTGTVSAYSATQLKFLFQIAQSGGAVTNAGIWASTYGEFGQNLGISVMAKVPILGWSSSVQMSNDTDTRVVAARYYATGSQSIGGTTVINFDTKDFDTHGAVSNPSTSWTYTAPVSGIYQIGTFIFTGGFPSTASWNVQIFKNAVQTAVINEWTVSSGTRGELTGSTLLSLNAGDALQIKTSVGAGSPTLDNSSGGGKQNYVNIQRLSGPSAIAASESVVARYTTAAGQAITGGAVTLVNFGTADYDSHGSVTTGASWKFTAPISGKYRVTACLASGAFTSSAGNRWTLQLYKNGASAQRIGIRRFDATLATNADVTGAGTINLLAGDYIDVRVDSSLNSVSLAADAPSNWIAVERIGN